MTDDLQELQGTLQSVRYHQDAFLIGLLADGTVVKGEMPSPRPGMAYAFRGRWEEHPRWGRQFAFAEHQASAPSDLGAIRAYLMENCRGIGPETSRRLVEAYGREALAVCKDDPERVAREIPGLPRRRAREVAALLREQEAEEALRIRLKEMLEGTPVRRHSVERIIALWGEDAPRRIRENPYALIAAVEGIGFPTADAVALRIGYDREGGPRLREGLLHVLQEQAAANGHACLPRERLLADAGRLLGAGHDLLAPEVDALRDAGRVAEEGGAVYLPALQADEALIARILGRLLRGMPPAGQPHFEGLAEDQREALAKAVASPVFILTGPPGTGKTFAIKRILSSFPQAKAALAAPTGKAAKRITEQTGRPALTMHRLLEPRTQDGERFAFSRGAEKPVEADLIVLDEVSMVDTWLMARFLEAVAPGTRLILVGDTDQLPSVGPGNVLKDLIASGAVPYTELTLIKRQDEGLIIRNCHRIRRGEDLLPEDGPDFRFLRRADEAGIREALLDLVARELPGAFKAHPLRDIQVITPLRERTGLSCAALNAAFQERLNPGPPVPGCRFKPGDKVIQTRNRYSLDLLNGDIGYILEVSPGARSLTAAFESPARTVEMPWQENDLELAYAVTCHKFQGSEARIVVIPVHRAFGTLVPQRNWLYTAVSRAREACILVGQRDEVPRIIRRNQQQRRFTGLAERLRGTQ